MLRIRWNPARLRRGSAIEHGGVRPVRGSLRSDGIPSRLAVAEVAVRCRLEHHRVRAANLILLLHFAYQPRNRAHAAAAQPLFHHSCDLTVGPAAHETVEDELFGLS